MSRPMARSLGVFLALVMALVALPAPRAIARTAYMVTDLGYMWPNAINAHGQIVGSVGGRAALYDSGVTVELVADGRALLSSEAHDINDGGLVVGCLRDPAYQDAAVMWSAGRMTTLGTLGGPSSCAQGVDIYGRVVGWSLNAPKDPRAAERRAFLYNGGRMTDLGTLPGDLDSQATDINEAGQIVGYSGVGDSPRRTYRAFLHDGFGMRDLGSPPGATSVLPTAINAGGEVVGAVFGGAPAGSFHWSAATGMTRLEALPGRPFTWATGINAAGRIVGNAHYVDEFGVDQAHAVMWEPGTRRVVDLNTLLPAGESRTLRTAHGINDAGQIIGVWEYGGGVLLTPTTVYDLTLTTSAGGAVDDTPAGPTYRADTLVRLVAVPNDGYVFTGWKVNAQPKGLANPLDIRMDADLAVHANFAPRPRFSDVPPTDLDYEAISLLAGLEIIRGFSAGECAALGVAHPCFGPDRPVKRAQAAALIVRTLGKDGESWPDDFRDLAGVDPHLQRNIRALAHYGVARGFGDGTYKPFGDVARIQVIAFITRAFVDPRGAWQYQGDSAQTTACATYNNVPRDRGHCQDLAAFAHYAGAVPGTTPGSAFTNYDQPATRRFFAQALVAALGANGAP